MNHKPMILAGVMSAALCVVFCGPAQGAAPLRVSIVGGAEGSYYEPAGGILVIETQPVRLSIRVQSTSDVAVGVRTAAEHYYSLELTDENGRVTTIKRRAKADRGAGENITQKLAPGEAVVFPLSVNPQEWEGVPDFTAPGQQKFKLRVLYNSLDYGQISSKMYTLVIRLPSEISAQQKTNSPAPPPPGVRIIQ